MLALTLCTGHPFLLPDQSARELVNLKVKNRRRGSIIKVSQVNSFGPPGFLLSVPDLTSECFCESDPWGSSFLALIRPSVFWPQLAWQSLSLPFMTLTLIPVSVFASQQFYLMSWSTLKTPTLFSSEKMLQRILSRWRFQNYSIANR